MNEFASSSKVEALVKCVQAMGKTAKGIVFSQFSSMIDVCEWRLQRVGVGTVKVKSWYTTKVTHTNIQTLTQCSSHPTSVNGAYAHQRAPFRLARFQD